MPSCYDGYFGRRNTLLRPRATQGRLIAAYNSDPAAGPVGLHSMKAISERRHPSADGWRPTATARNLTLPSSFGHAN